MDIQIIKNIESYLPLYEVIGNALVSIIHSEKPEIIILPIIQGNSEKEGSKGDIKEKTDTFFEGGIKQITIEVKRRDPELRRQAIIINGGYKCYICKFDFEDTYGKLGEQFIEVHHKVPLSEVNEERLITVEEVVVVCSNCHSILHHNGKKPIDVEVLKKIVEERRKAKSI